MLVPDTVTAGNTLSFFVSWANKEPDNNKVTADAIIVLLVGCIVFL